MSRLPTAPHPARIEGLTTRRVLLAVLCAGALLAQPARAGLIYLSQYGIETEYRVAFTLPDKPAPGMAAGTLFSDDGVLFSGAARVNSCASSWYNYAGIRGNHVTTLAGNCRTTVADEQFTLTLAQPVERFTMSLVASDVARKDHFTLFQGGAQVASFSLSSLRYYLGGDCADPLGCVLASQVSPHGYLVIDGIVFDQLRFTDGGADQSWLAIDNLGFDPVREVGEPPVTALVGAVLLALAAASRRRPGRA